MTLSRGLVWGCVCCNVELYIDYNLLWLGPTTDRSVVILGESTDDEDDEEECLYECLYDSLPVSQEKHLKQQDSSLVKIAEVAERSIKKLRRNWSIKKDDLSKGLSKIKRSSKTLIEDVYTKEGSSIL